MPIIFTVTVDATSGVDSNRLFAGTQAINKYSVDFDDGPGKATLYYTPAGADLPFYLLEATGSEFQATPFTIDVAGRITSLALSFQAGATSGLVPLAHLDIDFGDTVLTTLPVNGIYALTPDIVMNAYGPDVSSFRVIGNVGADRLTGSSGDDQLNGRGGADVMIGRGGDDRYYVDNAGDTVAEFAGDGADHVLASVGYTLKSGVAVERLTTTNTSATAAIHLTGNELGQQIEGNAGGNRLLGDDGADRLLGHGGNDVLAGGLGKDFLTGGLGNDQFLFDVPIAVANIDVVTDFTNATGNNDTLRLENAVFAKLTATGALNGAFFKANATGVATDSNDYVVYNTTTGALFYDADGDGSGAARQFATLTGKPAITAADFLVV